MQVPEGVSSVTVSVEDLANRGGPNYGYRLNVKRMALDFRVFVTTPYVNVPAGGSVLVPITVQRQGYDGEIEMRVRNAPKGLRVEGGFVVAGPPVKETPQNRYSRGALILTAEPGAALASTQLDVEGVAKLPDGAELVRAAEGPGMMVNVAGATEQGSVDRQIPVTAPWLDLELPAGTTKPQPATLEVSLVSRKHMQEGDEMKFRWKWHPREAKQELPDTVTSEMVGAGDVRMIDVQPDPKDPTTGTFLITTTKLTRPSKYDLYITGKVKAEGQEAVIVSRPISIQLEEVKSAHDAETASSR
jgi:hypothetical protein